MIVVGIDPGITGAIAMIEDGKVGTIWDMPTQNRGKPVRKRSPKTKQMITTQKKEIDPWTLSSIISYICVGAPSRYEQEKHIFIERVSAGAFGQGKDGTQRTQGVVSAFGFGDSFGVIRGVCSVFCDTGHIHFVRPQEWKSLKQLVGHDKDVARQAARVWFPDAASYLERKKDIGRADALMIADYGVHVCTQ